MSDTNLSIDGLDLQLRRDTDKSLRLSGQSESGLAIFPTRRPGGVEEIRLSGDQALRLPVIKDESGSFVTPALIAATAPAPPSIPPYTTTSFAPQPTMAVQPAPALVAPTVAMAPPAAAHAPPPVTSSPTGAPCMCRVCAPPVTEAKGQRQCTKGHKFEWLELCQNHIMHATCTHVNKCPTCRASRGFCVLTPVGCALTAPPRLPVPRLEEAIQDGKMTVWTPRDKNTQLESKRTGIGAKRPYQSNLVRATGFYTPNAAVWADLVVVVRGQLYIVQQVWCNGKLQPPMQVEAQTNHSVDFRLTLNPAEYRSLQPVPMSSEKKKRPKGIGWASTLFYFRSNTTVVPVWLWEDVPVVSDKFRPDGKTGKKKSEVSRDVPRAAVAVAAPVGGFHPGPFLAAPGASNGVPAAGGSGSGQWSSGPFPGPPASNDGSGQVRHKQQRSEGEKRGVEAQHFRRQRRGGERGA